MFVVLTGKCGFIPRMQREPGLVAHACNPSSGEPEQESPWDSFTTQPGPNWQVPESTVSKEQGKWLLRNNIWDWPVDSCAHTFMITSTICTYNATNILPGSCYSSLLIISNLWVKTVFTLSCQEVGTKYRINFNLIIILICPSVHTPHTTWLLYNMQMTGL